MQAYMVLTDNNAICMLHLDNYRPIYTHLMMMLFVFGHHITIGYLCWNPILEYCLNAHRNIHLYQCHQTSIIIYFTFILPFSVFALFYVGSQGSAGTYASVSTLNTLDKHKVFAQYSHCTVCLKPL